MRFVLSIFLVLLSNVSLAYYDYEESKDFAFKAYLLEKGFKQIGKNQVVGYHDNGVYIVSFNRANPDNEISLAAVIKKPVSNKIVTERFGGFCSNLALATSFSDHLHDYFDDLALINIGDLDLTQIDGVKVLVDKSIDLTNSGHGINYKITIDNRDDEVIYGVCAARIFN